MEQLLISLKLKLQKLGALRPEAWEMICFHLVTIQLKPNQSFVRSEGSLAFVAEGVLKEYDVADRKQPSIINFITIGQCIHTRSYNRKYYVKACTSSIIYFWNETALLEISKEFNELRPIYHRLCAEYDEGILFRMKLLEMTVPERISAFRGVFKIVMPYLKKKDIANYLNLHYTNFLRHWNS